MDADKLAILANQLGGYDEIENVLGIDAELAQRAVEGETLSPIENAQIETAYNQLYFDDDVRRDADARGVDLNTIDRLAPIIDETRHDISALNEANEYRALIAEGTISLDDAEQGRDRFADLTYFQARKVLDAIEDNPERARSMYDAYYYDEEHKTFGIKDSMFWAWFREIFYAD